MTDSPDWFTPATNVTLGSVDADVQAVGTKVDTVGTKVDTVGVKVDNVATQVTTVQTKVDAVSTAVATVQASVDAQQAGYGGKYPLLRFQSFNMTTDGTAFTLVSAAGAGVFIYLVSYLISCQLDVGGGVFRTLWDSYSYQLVGGALDIFGVLTPEQPTYSAQVPRGARTGANVPLQFTAHGALGDTAMRMMIIGNYFTGPSVL